jgi:DNA replication and repair protein RecF
VIVTRLRLRDFRSYAAADLALGEGVTVLHGRNGAGKTNLLEALFFGCTGRSVRTSNERELIRFGAPATRVEVDARDEEGRPHSLSVGFQPGEAKRLKADGAPVERLVDVTTRPLVSVFLPDRLELVKGAPSLRRAHMDQLVTAMWPSRAETRRAYSAALAQRNALLQRIRSGRAGRASLPAWDAEVARHGVALRDDRARAVGLVAESFTTLAVELGLNGEARLRFRPRSKAGSAEELAAELAERTDSDLDRGFTGHGPHRDDLLLERDGRELRSFGSQGEQRLGLLALLLAEREALADARGTVPLLLLDDVMSELDPDRRERLAVRVARHGQSVVTTTDLAFMPAVRDAPVLRVAVEDGVLTPEGQAAPGAAAAAAAPVAPRAAAGDALEAAA